MYVQTLLTHILVTHLQFIQPQQDPHRYCQVTEIQSEPNCNPKNWAAHNSCNGCICPWNLLRCIDDWEEHSTVVNSKNNSNIRTVYN